MEKVVEKIPITKITLEKSLDEKSAAIVFSTEDGEYVLKVRGSLGDFENLAVAEI